MLAAVVGTLLLQPHVAVPGKQVADLLDRIDRTAASEPIEYGIDTRIRAAEVLTAKYPSIAKRELRDGEASLTGVADLDYQNRLRVRIVAALAPIDFGEAERMAKTIPPERTHDRLAAAYDELYKKAGNRNRVDLIVAAFHAGAFRVYAVGQEKSATAALPLLAAVIDAFPPESPDRADIDYLLDRTEQFITTNRDLVFAAIRKSLAAADGQPKDKRTAVRSRAARLLRSLGLKPPEEFEPLLLEPEPPPEEEPKKSPDDEDLDLKGVPYSEALERALQAENAIVRAGALIDLSRREDLTPKQQARVAAEALTAVNKMPMSEERLWGLSMLSRDFAKHGDLANAALTAQMLSETYGRVCGCGAPVCEAHGEKLECVELVNEYAEYLEELHFTQESLGLNNISLEARLIVLHLMKALKDSP